MNRFHELLELPKILVRLAQEASFSASRELALGLLPSADGEEVQRWLRETSEAKALLALRPSLSIGGASDVRPLTVRAEKEDLLAPEEFLALDDTLTAGRRLRRELATLRERFPHLSEVAGRVQGCEELSQEIGHIIDRRGQVVDEASAELARRRRELKATHQELLDRLERIVHSSESASFIQEPFITQRSGRYVIPLKADFKGRVPGLVHDQSSSGATLFIEPFEVVELNNRRRELELAEEREVRAILMRLTAWVAEEGWAIRETVEALAQIDLALAKAQYSQAIGGAEPKLADFSEDIAEGRWSGAMLKLKEARHPLLREPAVPIDVHLGQDFIALVITGPNTGGKTVSLKTVGLLALMAQCGLHIPAGEESILPLFDAVYADIGDEQSIEQSLSTFSSHMGNIIHISQHATSRSLVLLDELGAGTDPVEGAALARAILSDLVSRRILTLATTHHSALKAYAHSTPGIENASVEFDPVTLAPTYRLTIGLPGQSNALAIAARLGLPPKLLTEAGRWLAAEDREAEGLLTEIRAARDQAVSAESLARISREEAERAEEELKARLAELEEERRQVINQARREARLELERARERLKEIEERLEARPGREWMRRARAELEGLAQELKPLPPPSRPGEEIAEGDRVWVRSLEREGYVREMAESRAEVEIGTLRALVELEDLERRGRGRTPSGEAPAHYMGRRPPTRMELNLRGQTVAEALPRLDRYLNDAYLAGLASVRIIHGKGTGILRRVVHEELQRHPLVAAFRLGDRYEGGSGATVAELVRRN